MTEEKFPFPVDFDPTTLTEVDDDYAVMELISAAKQDGSRVWAYVTIKPSLYMDYSRKILNGESLSIMDYGEIIQTGEGESPPDVVRADMEERFGADHEFSEKLKKTIQEYVKNHPAK